MFENDEHELRLGFDFIACSLMTQKKDIFFVEIGANDGIANDPVHRYVRDHGWSGLMIEPLPEVFETLKENYREYPDVTPLNFAIGDSDGTQKFYTVRIDPGMRQAAHQFSSFRREILERQTQWVPDILDRIEERTVECLSFNTLLERYVGDRDVDVLQIDVEGYDFEILKMIDFDRVKPSIINYESSNLTKAEQNACTRLLVDQGYRLAMGDSDTTGYLLPV